MNFVNKLYWLYVLALIIDYVVCNLQVSQLSTSCCTWWEEMMVAQTWHLWKYTTPRQTPGLCYRLA